MQEQLNVSVVLRVSGVSLMAPYGRFVALPKTKKIGILGIKRHTPLSIKLS